MVKALVDPPSLSEVLSKLVIGQQQAIDAICPYIEIHISGLSLAERPAGVFLFLGPTGTGKTRTVEAVAEALHGDKRKLIRVNCGEFQAPHEIAKLIGAPPGYLGHRETQPVFTQQKLNACISQFSDLAVVLFDEIEKAAPDITRLLLGVLDKATLHTGDNTLVSFENTLIFMTSNLGSRQTQEALVGWSPFQKLTIGPITNKAASISARAAKKHFSPEFMNRVDAVVTYRALSDPDLSLILDRELNLLQEHIRLRLGEQNLYALEVHKKAHAWLLEKGTSREYGARDLKRTIHREVLLPLARMGREIPGLSTVQVNVNAAGTALKFKVQRNEACL